MVVIFYQSFPFVHIIDREQTKSGSERTPFVIIEQRPMQIADERHIGFNQVHHLFNMHFEKMTVSHSIFANGHFSVVKFPANSHPIFGNQNRPITEVSTVMLAEKSHSPWAHATTPP